MVAHFLKLFFVIFVLMAAEMRYKALKLNPKFLHQRFRYIFHLVEITTLQKEIVRQYDKLLGSKSETATFRSCFFNLSSFYISFSYRLVALGKKILNWFKL